MAPTCCHLAPSTSLVLQIYPLPYAVIWTPPKTGIQNWHNSECIFPSCENWVGAAKSPSGLVPWMPSAVVALATELLTFLSHIPEKSQFQNRTGAKQSKAKCKPLDDWKPNHIIASPCSRFWPFDFVTKLCRFWSPDLAHKRFYTNGYSFNDMMSWCLRPLPGTNWSFRGLFFQLHQLNDAVDPLHNFHEWIAPPVRAKTHSEFEVAPAGITTGCRALFWFLTFYKPAETQLVMKHQSAVLFGHDGIFNQAGAYLPMPIKHWPVDGHIWP